MNTAPPVTAPLLEVEHLRKTYDRSGHGTTALDDVSFTLAAGEGLAIVGESGSGKSTIARLLLRLERPDAGRIALDGHDLPLRSRADVAFRSRVQLVFQDPFGSLNPRDTVLTHLARPLRIHGKATAATVRDRTLALLGEVGLNPAHEFIDKLPHALSGGQRQRVAIARALAPSPALLVADEPTSMLDVSLRMGILNLLAERKRRGLGLILITHDLASARYLADRILVLYAGVLVETAPTEALLASPRHPYTRLLLSAAARKSEPEPPHRADLPRRGTCPFLPRCPLAEKRCFEVAPPDITAGPRHLVRCHLTPPLEEPPP